jgi:hypothetical protein
MKKIGVFVVVAMLSVLPSVVMADHWGETKSGRLFLFQKCDETLIGQTVNGVSYDSSFGCPNPLQGPWPIFFGNNRFGKMDYSLWGPKFKFSFQGKRLLPKKNYTLIYYPDGWPGNGLICLGAGNSNKSGNINIEGNTDIGTSLPAQAIDANFNPISPSGAVGAKIWLVQTEDVDCGNDTSKMLNWDPKAYLFEYNLIVYERREAAADEDDED